jgi:hypothetical protein
VEVAFLSYEAFARIFLGQYDKAAELAQAALRVRNCQYWAKAHLAAALGHLSKNDEARNAVAELLRRKPDFSCRYAEEHLFYLESRVQLEHYLEGFEEPECLRRRRGDLVGSKAATNVGARRCTCGLPIAVTVGVACFRRKHTVHSKSTD